MGYQLIAERQDEITHDIAARPNGGRILLLLEEYARLAVTKDNMVRQEEDGRATAEASKWEIVEPGTIRLVDTPITIKPNGEFASWYIFVDGRERAAAGSLIEAKKYAEMHAAERREVGLDRAPAEPTDAPSNPGLPPPPGVFRPHPAGGF